ncbi:MAG: DUF885 domain-containing protein [Dehalococcoidia bacterium]|nr:DUF885 domain-containing protein [Dehalococcoidia bacterium]
MPDQPTPVYALADRYVEESAALDPIGATANGIAGHDSELTDYSPEGIGRRARHTRDILAALDGAASTNERDRVASAFIGERLRAQMAQFDADEGLRALRIIGSPLGSIRSCFDLMPRVTAEDWETIADRMEGVPAALGGFRAALDAGRTKGLLAARRQALECAKQAATWSGDGAEPFFPKLVEGAKAEVASGALRGRLDAAATAATNAYAAFATYLREEYAPGAPLQDAVGPDRYRVMALSTLGATIDLYETYAWAWEDLHRIEADMRATAQRIRPGVTVEQAKQLLETDPARSIEGVEAFRAWMQELQDRTIAELNGKHFDIPAPVQRVEAMIAPPGGAAAMYYTGPSEDFSRPGRTWYPTLGKTRFPLWGEVSIAYHEGVPGHHLQVAQVRYLAETLSRFQRTVFVSAHGEGWALYAERLMDELGYLENPDYRLGMLRAQAMRAVRVIVDIGMHLQLEIPAADGFHPGERWTPELGQAFVDERSHFPKDFMASEIVRYLGYPSQAICYKVGERVWLEARDAARARAGNAFDLKAFHAKALDLGPLGLDQMRAELGRL